MHLLINREDMNVLYKHSNITVLTNLLHIECDFAACVIEDNWHLFTDLELKKLYENLCGQKYVGYYRDALVNCVKHLCNSLDADILNGFEVSVQASKIDIKNIKKYKYQPGSKQALEVNELFVKQPRTAHANALSTLPINHTVQPVTSALPQALQALPALPALPMRISAPVNKDAPKAGSKTGRVWQLCDIWYEQAAKPVEFKTLRKQIMACGELEGINSSTMSVQFGAWKKNKTLNYFKVSANNSCH